MSDDFGLLPAHRGTIPIHSAFPVETLWVLEPDRFQGREARVHATASGSRQVFPLVPDHRHDFFSRLCNFILSVNQPSPPQKKKKEKPY